ncbi:MAG TPA: hypothetical protein VMV49_07325 [Candidatus Deferrimicrobium sp.]|nr:hypothetical protein [Candidatus Deferrimicrobium sp.]
MVSAKENEAIDDLLNDLMKPQPISVKAPPACYQDGKTYRKDKLDCILCDFFDSCV